MYYWQYPAFILAILGIVGMMFRMSRTYARHEKTLEEHSDLVKKCRNTAYVTAASCNESRKDCSAQQAAENVKLLKAIRDIADRFDQNIKDLHVKFETRQQQNHDELMKMNKALGRIEGVVGKHRFNDE